MLLNQLKAHFDINKLKILKTVNATQYEKDQVFLEIKQGLYF